MSSSSKSALAAAAAADVDVPTSTLAEAWSRRLMELLPDSSSSADFDAISGAASRALPLIRSGSTVPFVCRYRPDVVRPLTTAQVHALSDLNAKHEALRPIRRKVLAAVVAASASSAGGSAVPPEVLERIRTTASRSELDDLYAPHKPPPRGSIAERIRVDHPGLAKAVDGLWSGRRGGDRSSGRVGPAKKLRPRDAAVHLLGTKIASESIVCDAVADRLNEVCRVTTKRVAAKRGPSAAADDPDADSKYRPYRDFRQPLKGLRDHQVLAIRRGHERKALTMGYDVDGDPMERLIRRTLIDEILPDSLAESWKRDDGGGWQSLGRDAVRDAWTRLLRRRCASRIWSDRCRAAERRAIGVFETNLKNALLAPSPLGGRRQRLVLALDPGFRGGIKCAAIDPNGEPVRPGGLETVRFLGKDRDGAAERLGRMLSLVKDKEGGGEGSAVSVALGNGHGSHECRSLLRSASDETGIPVEVHLVNEAGASVWSVSPGARLEFPDLEPSTVAAISLGRRLQSPLHELVKVPPRSLGLGMYQHDLPKRELDDKLGLAGTDAVAAVGVEANGCSLEILRLVPGLNGRLAAKVVQARPFRKRSDLLDVPGLGPKTFENCAAFVRVDGGPEVLDSTLVHPESYGLAKWLLRRNGWTLSGRPPDDVPPRDQWATRWDESLTAASKAFGVRKERVMAVLGNLLDSMAKVDPRRKAPTSETEPVAGSAAGCAPLRSNEISSLRDACPVRSVLGIVRNVTDFGAFVDFGGRNDGLLHKSKLGLRPLEGLLIGQEIGIDVLRVDETGRVSLGLAGLDLDPDAADRTEAAPRGSKPTKGPKGGASTAGGSRGGARGDSSARSGRTTNRKRGRSAAAPAKPSKRGKRRKH